MKQRTAAFLAFALGVVVWVVPAMATVPRASVATRAVVNLDFMGVILRGFAWGPCLAGMHGSRGEPPGGSKKSFAGVLPRIGAPRPLGSTSPGHALGCRP